jgi:hypothetical protein
MGSAGVTGWAPTVKVAHAPTFHEELKAVIGELLFCADNGTQPSPELRKRASAMDQKLGRLIIEAQRILA